MKKTAKIFIGIAIAFAGIAAVKYFLNKATESDTDDFLFDESDFDDSDGDEWFDTLDKSEKETKEADKETVAEKDTVKQR